MIPIESIILEDHPLPRHVADSSAVLLVCSWEVVVPLAYSSYDCESDDDTGAETMYS